MRIFVRGLVALGVAAGALALWAWWSLTPPPPLAVPEPGVTLSGVTLINPGIERWAGRRIEVVGDRIAAIGPTPPDEPAGPYAGAYVLPGLSDLHVHFAPAGAPAPELFALLFLRHGVTTVRDAGDVFGTATAPVRSGVAGGAFPGPRVLACGPFVDGEEATWPNSRRVLDPSEADAVVAEIARDFDCVKTYISVSPEVARAVHEAARRRGLPVIGHVPQGSRVDDAQLDDVQHMMGMAFAEGAAGPFPQSLKAWRGLTESRMQEIVAVALERGLAITPTFFVVRRLGQVGDPEALLREPDLQLLPRYFREGIWQVRRDLTPDDFAGLRDALEIQKRLLLRLHAAGVELHVGSDTLARFVVPGASLHGELAFFVEAGLAPRQVLALATRGNGSFLARWKPELRDLGRVVPGAPADLLVFRQDPTRALAALDGLEAVVAAGRLYTREALDAQLERYRSFGESFVFDRVSVFMARRALGGGEGS